MLQLAMDANVVGEDDQLCAVLLWSLYPNSNVVRFYIGPPKPRYCVDLYSPKYARFGVWYSLNLAPR